MTKKTVFSSSFIAVLGMFLFLFAQELGICTSMYVYDPCTETFDDLALTLSPFIVVFFFSFLALFLRDEVFGSWWKFVRVALPLAIFAIFLAPSYSNDWMYPIEKGTVATFAFLALSLGSIFVFLRAVFRKR